MWNPFRYFNSSPAVIRTAVLLYFRFPLSLRQVEDLLHERGIDDIRAALETAGVEFIPKNGGGPGVRLRT